MRRIVALVCGLVVLAACGGGDANAEGIDGRWDGGQDWGEVIIDGLSGTYSDTFGADPGEIELVQTSDTTYEGTWNEGGTARFGTMELEVRSSDLIVGTWNADPASTIAGSSGGQLRWEK
jgi:hypothetical protein